MGDVLAVGLGAFLGANLRWALSRVIVGTFPLATLAANVLAGLGAGVLMGLDAAPAAPSPRWRLFLNTGLLGGLSTFSTFSRETVSLFMGGKYLPGAANILLNLALSLGAVAAGLSVVKLLCRTS